MAATSIHFSEKERAVLDIIKRRVRRNPSFDLDYIIKEFYKDKTRGPKPSNHRSSMAALMRSLVLKTIVADEGLIIEKVSGLGRGNVGEYKCKPKDKERVA
jgi:hypothetical protein